MISRENNFDLIRLIAAFQVAIIHTAEHLQLDDAYLQSIGGISFPFPGVFVFFVISGFLITASCVNNVSFVRYLKNRVLRIFPALWCAFLLLFVVLCVCGYINRDTLKLPQLWAWMVGQTTVFEFYTPDVLRGFGVGCPNGSLWTIPVEFGFYLLLPLVIYICRKRLNICLIVLSVMSLGVNYINALFLDGTVMKLIKYSFLPWLYCFFIGSLLYLNWDAVRKFFEGKAIYWILVYGLYVNLVTGPSYQVVLPGILGANILLAFLTISLAYTIPKMGGILHGIDISYGLYLYHMIVVNVFVELGFVGEWKYGLASLALSVLLGLISWLLIEKKALSLKDVKFRIPFRNEQRL